MNEQAAFQWSQKSIAGGTLRVSQSTEPTTLTPQQYADYSGAQRLVALYMYLMTGTILRPSQYAKAVGTSRFNIYRQKRALEAMNIPIVQLDHVKSGKWTLKQFAKEVNPLEKRWNDAHKQVRP